MEKPFALPRENKMGIMPINRLLLSMSIPMMVSMTIQALYNVVDSLFVARIGEDALTAVSLAFPVQNVMISLAVGTAVGVNAVLSRSLGEKNQAEVNNAANNGIFLAFVCYLFCLVFGLFFVRPYFAVQTRIKPILDYGYDYLSVVTTFSFAIFAQIMFERLLQSTGMTFYTMIAQGAGAVVNIILDPVMIFGLFGFPALGVRGAAIATVIGQAAGFGLALFFNLRFNRYIQIELRGFRPNWITIKNIYKVGVPSIVMMTIGSVMTFGMNKILLAISSTATAVFGVYFRLQSFIFMPVFGLNNGIVPIVAFNYGARNKTRIVRTIKISVAYAMGIMVIGVLIFQFLPRELLLLFNASPAMMAIGVHALPVISWSFLGAGFCVVSGTVFQSLFASHLSMIVSVTRQLVVLLPAALILASIGGLNLVWWSFPIAEVASVVFSAVFLRKLYVDRIKPLG
ncbi:MAG: MATE family efflux transporter [Treponema sp.]|jgi:putative MATE family efflux protein|nr:MATE family efflux transporter [Treponema sp.]